MQAIVSLLDQDHRDQLQDLWQDLKSTFGLESKYTRFLPHLSWQLATAYPEGIKTILEEFAATREPFTVKTAGFGMFTRPRSVIFLPLVRSPKLSLVHSTLWYAVTPPGAETSNYHPDRWMPHITLVYGNIVEEELGTIINYLAHQIDNWEITIDNIALIDDTILDERTEFTLPFKSKSDETATEPSS